MLSKFRIPTLMFVVSMTLFSSLAFANGHRDHEDVMAFFFLKRTDYNLKQAMTQIKGDKEMKFLSAEIEMDDDQIVYQIKHLENDKVTETVINPKTQKILETNIEGIFSRYSDEEDRAAAIAAKIGLAEAMKIAKKQYNGVIVDAEFKYKKFQSLYKIKIVNSRGMAKIRGGLRKW